ncbi:MAG: HlyD family secretion protein [Verrucomicrobiota bacterium]|jgi:HlyD family secretion protein
MAATKSSSRWKWILILGLLAAGGAYGAWRWQQGGHAPPQYQVAPVARGDLIQLVTATGQLNPVTNVQVGSQISGMIQKLSADFNSRVKAGEVIAELDPSTYQANLHLAEGELANAGAALELAQVEARRNADLLNQKLLSPSDYDKSQAALHQAEAQIKIHQASIEKDRVDLARCTILAPVDGIVISRNVDVGQTVAASLNAPILFVIANDLTKMQIDANVAEADVGGIEPGQEVEFTVDAFPYRTFRGRVVQVRNAPLTVQNVVTYDTVIEVDNSDLKLKPGMTANVSIITARRQNVLKIPNGALRFRPPEMPDTRKAGAATNTAPPAAGAGTDRPPGRPGGGSGSPGRSGGPGGAGRGKPERQSTRTVYRLPAGAVANASPQPVPVKTGISDGISTEVLDGLAEGDSIITGLISSQTTAPRPQNPFGGGTRRF